MTEPAPLLGRVATVAVGPPAVERAVILALTRAGAVVVARGRGGRRRDEPSSHETRDSGQRGFLATDHAGRGEARSRPGRTSVNSLGPLDLAVLSHWAPGLPSPGTPDALLPTLEALRAGARSAGAARRVGVASAVLVGAPGAAHDERDLARIQNRWALPGLVRSLALRFAPDVRVNAVEVGPIRLGARAVARGRPGRRRELDRRIPLGASGTPEDVAEAVVFLASGDAGFVTGETLVVDGGASLVYTLGGPGP